MTTMTILVTGVNGFVGKHLVRELKVQGHQVVGLGQDELSPDIGSLLMAYETCDLTDAKQVAKVPLGGIEAVINLAGLARVGQSFGADDLYKKVNVGVLTVLSERLLAIGSKARVIAVSTGAVYRPDQPMPLTEVSQTIQTGSPYALSKLMMEEAAHDLRRKGLDCIIVRPFNHTGPGQGPGFILADLYQRIIEAQTNGQPITISPQVTKRDFTDVRDVAKAYIGLVSAKRLDFDTYNICSGVSHSGHEILDLLLDCLELRGKVTLQSDESLIRPHDPTDLYGSYERIAKQIGWRPTISLEQTVQDFVAARQSS